MTKNQVFDKLVELQELVWKGDDLMDQEVLFDVQDKLSELTLEVAKWIGNTKCKVLVDKFPYLYKEG